MRKLAPFEVRTPQMEYGRLAQEAHARRDPEGVKARRAAYHRANKDRAKVLERTQRGVVGATAEVRSGVCPVCLKARKRLLLDHEHDTGRIRGWLCSPCNTFLGRTDAEALARAERVVAYIKGT